MEKRIIAATARYHTLQDIAEMLKQGLLKCEEFKGYTSWICSESYPDIEQHEQEADAIRSGPLSKTTASSVVYPSAYGRIGRNLTSTLTGSPWTS